MFLNVVVVVVVVDVGNAREPLGRTVCGGFLHNFTSSGVLTC